MRVAVVVDCSTIVNSVILAWAAPSVRITAATLARVASRVGKDAFLDRRT